MTEQNSQKENSNSLEDLKNKVVSLSVEKRWAMSCYIPVVNLFTCVLTSVKMINSKFCRFHARQGLVVFALWAIAILIGVVVPTFGAMLQGVFLLLCIAGMVISYRGKETSIPVVGQFAMKIPEHAVFKFLTGKIPEKDAAIDNPAAVSNNENEAQKEVPVEKNVSKENDKGSENKS